MANFFWRAAVATALLSACGSSSAGDGGVGDGGQLGPGAAYKCSSGKDAYDTYQLAGFESVTNYIFAAVVAEDMANGAANLGPTLQVSAIGSMTPPANDDPLAAFEARLTAFLVYAYGGPTSIKYTDGSLYSGTIDMTAAHTGMNITSTQYDYFVQKIVVPSLLMAGVSQGDVTACFAPVITDPAFKASIVGH